jgi:hypothetical protein
VVDNPRFFRKSHLQLYSCSGKQDAISQILVKVQKGNAALIKTVATALVLIVGAAVVLWYGNTLNSWVVGGLVGGFGALLLSIPISLVLFSYFSHHYHKPQQEDILGDEVVLVQRGSYSLVQDQLPCDDDEEYFDEDQEVYYEYGEQEICNSELDVDDEYVLAEQSVWEEEQSRRVPPPRNFSARFPMASQDSPSQMQRNHYGADPERRSLQREKSESRPVKNTGSRGLRTDSSFSRYRSEALRAARMEAALRAEYDEESGFPSTRATRRLEQMQRSNYASSPQGKSGKSRTSHDLIQPSTNSYPRRPRRIVDALPPQARFRD